MTGKRIVTIESDPQVIGELCQYDKGEIVDLSERALGGLDVITAPKKDHDNTSTALGFIALIRQKHPSTLLPAEENPYDQMLVATSRTSPYRDPYDGFKVNVPDGIYTLIPAA